MRIFHFLIFIFIISFFTSCGENDIISDETPPDPAPWRNHRYDYSNTGYYHGYGPTQGVIVDTINIGRINEGATPVFDKNGNLYIANEDGISYKIDSNHSIVWSVDLDTRISGSASVLDSIVVWASKDKFIFGISTHDGSVNWTIDIGDETVNPPIIHTELQFGVLTTLHGLLYIFDLNGNVIKNIDLGENNILDFIPVPAIDEDGNIYVVTRNEAYCFDMLGNEVWHETYDEYYHHFGNFIAYSKEKIFYKTYLENNSGFYLVAVDATNGELLWMSTTNHQFQGFTPYYEFTITDDYIIIPNEFVGIEYFDLNGNHVKTDELENEPFTSILIDLKDNFYYGTEYGELLVSKQNNSINWSLSINQYYLYDLVVNDEKIFFVTREHPNLWIIE
jgi:hypothetical protein|tara:strand:- start:730 stop:1905 length:1176 start_codon:yes stop_codon:yes gene_type:complete